MKTLIITLLILISSLSFADAEPFAIIINGTSSCGKSTASRALRDIYTQNGIDPVLVSGDDIIRLLPKDLVNIDNTEQWSQPNNKGLQFVPQEDGSLKVHMGQSVQNVLNAIPGIIESFLENGTSVIFEGGLPNNIDEKFQQMQSDGKRVFTVLLSCSIATVEKREKQRNGFTGLGKSLLSDPNFFSGPYSLSIKLDETSSKQAAQDIFDKAKLKFGY